MTEDEWRRCNNFTTLNKYVRSHWSERKQWLFSCACVRLVWHLLSDVSREALLAVERHLEGAATEEELELIFPDCYPSQRALPIPGGTQAAEVVERLGWKWRWKTRESMSNFSLYTVSRTAAEGLAQTIPWSEARAMQCALLRDILRNPEGEWQSFDPNWTRYNGGSVANLAATIYEDRAFDLMPILADALEDAGCTDEHLVEHCREPDLHVRGCWALDLCLSRK